MTDWGSAADRLSAVPRARHSPSSAVLSEDLEFSAVFFVGQTKPGKPEAAVLRSLTDEDSDRTPRGLSLLEDSEANLIFYLGYNEPHPHYAWLIISHMQCIQCYNLQKLNDYIMWRPFWPELHTSSEMSNLHKFHWRPLVSTIRSVLEREIR